MTKRIRSLLAMLLAIVMIVGLLPTVALAREAEPEVESAGSDLPQANGMQVHTPYGLKLGSGKQATRGENRDLPKSFNSVNEGWITSVKNQTQYGQYGTCWAFGTMAPIEAYMIKNEMQVGSTGETATTDLDLSEYHLSYFNYSNSYDEHNLTSGDSSILDGESHVNVGGDGYKATLTMMRWIGARIGKEKKKIRRPVMERLMQITGTDMTNIDSELEKLLSYVMSPDRPTAGEDPDEITLADLEEILAPQLEDQIFDMIRAVASHHQKQALDYYYELLALREAPLKIMALLTREYLQLYHVSELAAEGRPQNVIATAAGIPPFVVRRSLEVSRLYKRGEIRAILDDFAATEEDVKQGKISDRLAVEMLIIRYSSAAQRR